MRAAKCDSTRAVRFVVRDSMYVQRCIGSPFETNIFQTFSFKGPRWLNIDQLCLYA